MALSRTPFGFAQGKLYDAAKRLMTASDKWNHGQRLFIQRCRPPLDHDPAQWVTTYAAQVMAWSNDVLEQGRQRATYVLSQANWARRLSLHRVNP
jgi:hypothetical protein